MRLVNKILRRFDQEELKRQVVAQLTDSTFVDKLSLRVSQEIEISRVAQNIAGEIEDEVLDKVTEKIVSQVEEELTENIDIDYIVEEIVEEVE